MAFLETEEDMHERVTRDNPVTEAKPSTATRVSKEKPEKKGRPETKDNPENLDQRDRLALGQCCQILGHSKVSHIFVIIDVLANPFREFITSSFKKRCFCS